MTWAHPLFFLLLALSPLLLLRGRVQKRATVRFSDLQLARVAAPTLRQRLHRLPRYLKLLALALMVAALARPQKGNELTRISAEGIAISLVLDRSGSMQAIDSSSPGENPNRLEVVKKVSAEFITGGSFSEGRASDQVSLVTFARFADAKCPATLDHANLLSILSRVKPVPPTRQEREDGTAIGDAVALACERLEKSEVKSRVIILLTDGENNAGHLSPLESAEMAAALGIKIYPIGVGSDEAYIMMDDPFFGPRPMPVRFSIDEKTLRGIADRTGGHFYRASDEKTLREIYHDIDRLEKTKTEVKRYLEYLERFRLFLLPALALLVLAEILSWTWLRKLP